MSLFRTLPIGSGQARQLNLIGKLCLQHRQYASSSDDEGQGSKKLKEDPKARAEYRSWVENMLSAIQTEAQGRVSSPEKGDAQASAQPAEHPATGSSEGNLGMTSDNIMPEASVQAVPEPLDNTTSLQASGEPGNLQGGNLGLPEAEGGERDGTSASDSAAAAGSIPKRTTVREAAGFMPDSVRGYRELGISESGDGGMLDQGEGHINSVRKFWPGDMYDPEDLVATTHKSYDTKPWMRAQVKVKKATNADALREADFRNVAFLHKFTSETGNLPPRKVTKLQKKFHTHVMRQIKIARNMALLPPEGKLEELLPQGYGRRPPSIARTPRGNATA